VVNKQPTTTGLVCVPPNPHVSQLVTCTATVNQTIVNPTVPTGTVSFYIDGSLTPAATIGVNVSAQAVFLTTFGGGTHTVIAVYNGDGNYLSSMSPTATETVACDVTITGTHSSLIASHGVVCILNAHITGGITVEQGVTLDVEGSHVDGSISAYRSSTFRVCGSTVASITVTKATGFVLIGDPTHNCPANTINGSLTATQNTAGLVIVGNRVSGGLLASGNSGTGPLPGESSPIVSGNHH
jgi:5'-nucleotidase